MVTATDERRDLLTVDLLDGSRRITRLCRIAWGGHERFAGRARRRTSGPGHQHLAG